MESDFRFAKTEQKEWSVAVDKKKGMKKIKNGAERMACSDRQEEGMKTNCHDVWPVPFPS